MVCSSRRCLHSSGIYHEGQIQGLTKRFKHLVPWEHLTGASCLKVLKGVATLPLQYRSRNSDTL